MPTQAALEKFQQIIKPIGEILLASLDEDLPGEPWKSAFLDVRGSAEGDSRLNKWRVERPDGTLICTLDSPVFVTHLLTKAYDLRKKAFDEKWYGLLITVFPDKRCEVAFNYDSACVKDPSFWRSQPKPP